jgi:hypothetical protein
MNNIFHLGVAPCNNLSLGLIALTHLLTPGRRTFPESQRCSLSQYSSCVLAPGAASTGDSSQIATGDDHSWP